jgi:putative DNA primase/helicase
MLLHHLGCICIVTPYDFLARGWSIFPCHTIAPGGRCTCNQDCGKNAGKHPRTMNGVKDATKDPRTVATWIETFGEGINWSLACGRDSGVVAIDIDPQRGGGESLQEWQQSNGLLPGTLTSITGGGGYHLIYTLPFGLELRNRNDMLPGVDVRADGGYILLPPSRHRSGSQYAWRDPVDITPTLLPDNLAYLIQTARAPEVQLDLSTLTPIPEGQRNETLFRKTCQLRRQLRDDRLAVEASIRAYNAALCVPPLEEYDLQKLINSAFTQDHVDPALPEWNPVLGGDVEQRAMTDIGNGLRLVDYYGTDVRYTEGMGWWKWAGHKWVHDGEGQYVQEHAKTIHERIRDEAAALEEGEDIGDQLRRWSIQSQSVGKVAAMTKLATSDPRVLRNVDEFDRDGFTLGCRNGVLNLLTGELRPHDRNDLITQCTNIEFEHGYKLDDWEKFLWTSCEGDQELIDYLQRAVGYTLTGSIAEEAFFIITGPPATGKSTFIEAIMSAMGEYAETIATETILLSHGGNQGRREGDLAKAFGKRLVATSEISDGARLDESAVKQLTGGDRVMARMLYKNPFSYRPQFKLWIATNHAPTINDQAMWRRVKRIPFNRKLSHSERDPKLKQILRDPSLGGKAVLAWALEGAQQWYAQRLNEPARITQEVHEYHADQDRLAEFVAETLVKNPGTMIAAVDVYAAYTTWCMGIGERSISRPRLIDKLREQGFRIQRMGNRQFICDYDIKTTVTGSARIWPV